MKKQNVVLIYSIYFPECGKGCYGIRPTLGLSLFVEKENTFKPLSIPYGAFKSHNNIFARLKKKDEYRPLWHGALMYGRNKDKLLETWNEYHRVHLACGVIDFNNDEEALKGVIEECNNNPHPEVCYNILKAKMREQF